MDDDGCGIDNGFSNDNSSSNDKGPSNRKVDPALESADNLVTPAWQRISTCLARERESQLSHGANALNSDR
jgi:hypothetical protein